MKLNDEIKLPDGIEGKLVGAKHADDGTVVHVEKKSGHVSAHWHCPALEIEGLGEHGVGTLYVKPAAEVVEEAVVETSGSNTQDAGSFEASVPEPPKAKKGKDAPPVEPAAPTEPEANQE